MHRGSGNIKQRKLFVPLSQSVIFTVKPITAIAKGIDVNADIIHQVIIAIGNLRVFR